MKIHQTNPLWHVAQRAEGDCKKKGNKLFSRVCCARTRGNGFQPKERRFRQDMRNECSTKKVVRHWNRLPREAVDAPSLETLKVRLDGALSILNCCRCPCSLQRSWTGWRLRVPSNSNDSMILCHCVHRAVLILLWIPKVPCVPRAVWSVWMRASGLWLGSFLVSLLGSLHL